MKKLRRDFYKRGILLVAKDLLGKIFVKEENGLFLSGKIVEVEAYAGALDEASHTYGGISTRNNVMFREGGHLYVYFTYGAHYCCNVVTGEQGIGEGILIRGIEPVKGADTMAMNRFGKSEITEKEFRNLTSGPGKICKAFDITKKDNGVDITKNYIYILDNPPVDEKDIVTTKRIGITRAVDLPWRFYLKDNPFISRK